jgi:catechol-2,3-dioxygenase
MSVQRLNHAVFYVANVEKSVEFYTNALGMEVAHRYGAGAAFLRCRHASNDHDLGLFEVGSQKPGPAPGRRGLYHLAWQVDTFDELVTIGKELQERGSLVGMSDHGVSKSLYALDPDGIEFEIMWAVPRAAWPSDDGVGVMPLAIDRELAQWTGVRTGHEANTAVG